MVRVTKTPQNITPLNALPSVILNEGGWLVGKKSLDEKLFWGAAERWTTFLRLNPKKIQSQFRWILWIVLKEIHQLLGHSFQPHEVIDGTGPFDLYPGALVLSVMLGPDLVETKRLRGKEMHEKIGGGVRCWYEFYHMLPFCEEMEHYPKYHGTNGTLPFLWNFIKCFSPCNSVVFVFLRQKWPFHQWRFTWIWAGIQNFRGRDFSKDCSPVSGGLAGRKIVLNVRKMVPFFCKGNCTK